MHPSHSPSKTLDGGKDPIVDAVAAPGLIFRIFSAIERVGNKIPHPFWLFWILSGVVAVLSLLMSNLGVSVVDPASGETVLVKNLLSGEGLRLAVTDAMTNFGSFIPLSVIVLLVLGTVVAEKSGLISTAVRLFVYRVPPFFLTFALSVAAMFSHVAGDAAYVVMIPIGGLVFKAAGRSPVLGMIVAFLSISAGYDASPLITTTDAILAGLTTAAAQTVDPSYIVTPVGNYYFSLASSIFVALIITVMADFVMARRPDLAQDITADGELDGHVEPTSLEKKAALIALVVGLAFVGLVAAVVLMEGSPLRGEDGSLLNSPFLKAIGVPLSLTFFLSGLAYGLVAKTIKSLNEIPDILADGLRTVAPILVLFFSIAQFLAYFKWSGIGTVVAVSGAESLAEANLSPGLILLGLALVISLFNFLITASSALWALAAPIFVPMLMYIGISPETTQAAYRLADSVTNAMTPMSYSFVMCLIFIQRYRKDAGIGTLVSYTFPICIVLWIGWMIFFQVWLALGIPFGPGAPLTFTP